jgi:hypothetical protein
LTFRPWRQPVPRHESLGRKRGTFGRGERLRKRNFLTSESPRQRVVKKIHLAGISYGPPPYPLHTPSMPPPCPLHAPLPYPPAGDSFPVSKKLWGSSDVHEVPFTGWPMEQGWGREGRAGWNLHKPNPLPSRTEIGMCSKSGQRPDAREREFRSSA